MNAIDTIKNKVTRGLVLDSKGNWVTLASLKEVEQNVITHLKAGDVLHEGKWVSLKNLKIAPARSPDSGLPPPPKTNHLHAIGDDVEHISNKKATPWTVVSLSTGEQHMAQENMIPVISDIGPTEGVLDGSSNMWKNATNSQLKIIALVSSAIVLLSLAVFIGIRLIF
jgi:hypothetical protein